MSRAKGKKDKPWVLTVESVIPGMTQTMRKRYALEATATKQAGNYNPKWFKCTIKKAHD